MAWQVELIEVLRVLVNDLTETPVYSDQTLKRVLLVAGLQLSQELVFSQTYLADVVQAEFTPDPTVTASRDESFINLVCLKAACIIDRGAAATAAKQAIAVKDGSSAIDLRGVSAGKLALLAKGWCAVFEDAKLEYQSGQVRVAGAAVMTPFRTCVSNGRGMYVIAPGRSREGGY